MAKRQYGRFWVADWFVDSASNTIRRSGTTRRLERRTMDLLITLAKHQGSTVSKDEIVASAWSTHVVSDQSIVTAVSDLRKALGDDPRQPTFIETVPKRGYKFIASVSLAPVESAEQTDPSGSRRQSAGRHLAWRVATIVTIAAVTAILIGYPGPRLVHAPTTLPIVLGDVCVGNVDAQTQDLAYGFGELLSVSLSGHPGRAVVRIADETAFQPESVEPAAGGGALLVDTSIVVSAGTTLVVLEVMDGLTREVLWGEKYPISPQSLEKTATRVADHILNVSVSRSEMRPPS